MTYDHITPSGGLLTNQFIEALQQPTFNHPALQPETFRLPNRKGLSPAELERAIGSAWELLVERWDGIERDISGMDLSTFRSRWILPLMGLLDFDLEYQRSDIVLQEDLRFPISHLAKPAGSDDREAFIPVHTVLPLEAGLDARRDGGSGVKRLSPHDLLQRYLNLAKDAQWGLLCDGIHLRLLRDYHHTYTRGFVEFDLQGIFTTRDFAAFRGLYRLCHASRFISTSIAPAPAAPSRKKTKPEEEEEEGEPEAAQVESLTPLEQFYQSALSTGVRVGEDLRKSVRVAIETLGNGFLTATPGWLDQLQAQPDGTRRLYDEILHIIYRILFLMFAEQRGMLPGRGSLYMDEFSLTALRSQAERPIGEDRHIDLWERLKATFSMLEKGVPELDVFGYDGVLFGQAHMPLLTPADEQAAPHLSNSDLLTAMRALSTVDKDGILQRISYLDLSVEEIGSVYESLLDFTPRIAAYEEKVDGRTIRPGQFYLDPRGKERKTTGSYYTHPSLVNELIRTALLPVMEDRLKTAVTAWDAEHPERLSAEQRQAAAEALLNIKVVDPACGSGAFLIAADNALGLQLARIRAGDLYPTEAAVRAARREVLTHCIYGVDLNPMAVELCKVSLWINAAVPDQKLNFLDHHIKCGNSLVGATRALVSQGVPDDAYNPLTGDDRALASAFKTRNKAERQGQLSVLRVTEIRTEADFRLWLELTRLAQDDPAEAERRYLALHSSSEDSAERLAFDLWTAAFFWPHRVEEGESDLQRAKAGIQARKSKTLQPPAPTTQDVLQALATTKLVNSQMLAYARHLAEENHFFHWELEFPEVFAPSSQPSPAGKVGEGSAGFDVVLGNPPWERIKLQEVEFFGTYDSSIAEAPNAAARKRIIEGLQRSNPHLWNLYRQALHQAEANSRFLRSSSRYPLSARGDINTYQVFAEHDRNLTAPHGHCGIIVPSGIATDFSNKDFFADLVEHSQLASLYDFENRRGIFPGVHRSYKFCLLTLRGAKFLGRSQPAEFAFFMLAVDDLQDEEKRFTLTAEDFARINPNTHTTPIFRTRTDAQLTTKLYEAAPVLDNENTGENPWGVSFLSMFHMTNDSWLFITEPREGYLPLYESKMIWVLDHRYVDFRGATQANLNQGTLPQTSIEDKKNPFFQVSTRYYVSEIEVSSRLAFTNQKWLLGFRDITNNASERTAIFSIIPKVGVGNNLPLIFLDNFHKGILLPLLGCLTSLVFDFVVRQKIAGLHMNFFFVKQLPVLHLRTYNQMDLDFIAPRILELVYTSIDLKPFAEQMEYQGEPFKWSEDRRSTLRSELDAYYARLYGLNRKQLRYILDPADLTPRELDDILDPWEEVDDPIDSTGYNARRAASKFPGETFRVLKEKEIRNFGEYRTRRQVLEAWDRLSTKSKFSEPVFEQASPITPRTENIILTTKSVSPLVGLAKKIEEPPVPIDQVLSKAATRMTDSISPTDVAEEHEEVATPNEMEAPSLADFGMYRCESCNKIVLGFDRPNHNRDFHAGKEPPYKKIR